MINPEWGTKRNCPSCSTHFYDLNKVPVTCPKCQNQFDPGALIRGKKKTVKREAPTEKNIMSSGSILAGKKAVAKNKEAAEGDDANTNDDINSIAEMEDVDDIENLKELSELEEIESTPSNEDDADEEAIIDELETGDKAIVGNIEDEEAKALEEDLDDNDKPPPRSKHAKSKYSST